MTIIPPSLHEAEAKALRELLRRADARRELQEFVIEGPHLLEEALNASANIRLVAITESMQTDAIVTRLTQRGISVRTITEKWSSRIADSVTPQGIFAVVRIPEIAAVASGPILALDAVQDPGNVGTLLRTAAWFGVRDVLLGNGTADVYNPKTIRATQGAIFRVAIREHVELTAALSALRNDGYQLYAAMLSPEAQSIYDVSWSARSVVVLGSEAHGVSAAVERACDTTITIPRIGVGESLNVAASGAVLLSELTRPR